MEIEMIQQLLQQQNIEGHLSSEMLLSNVFANFMQKHVSQKYFMLSMEYSEELMRFS